MPTDDLDIFLRSIGVGTDGGGAAPAATMEAPPPLPKKRRSMPAPGDDASGMIQRIYQEEGAPVDIGLAMAQQEGGRYSTGNSIKGAQGPLQVMPKTGLAYVSPDEWATTEGKVRAAARYSRHLAQRYPGRDDLQIAGFHAGETNVDNA